MIKLKISYENQEELKKFLDKNKSQLSKIRISKENKGKYKKLYAIVTTSSDK